MERWIEWEMIGKEGETENDTELSVRVQYQKSERNIY